MRSVKKDTKYYYCAWCPWLGILFYRTDVTSKAGLVFCASGSALVLSLAVRLLGIIFSSMHFFVDETHTLLYHKGLSQLFEVASLHIQYAILYPLAPSHNEIFLPKFHRYFGLYFQVKKGSLSLGVFQFLKKECCWSFQNSKLKKN